MSERCNGPFTPITEYPDHPAFTSAYWSCNLCGFVAGDEEEAREHDRVETAEDHAQELKDLAWRVALSRPGARRETAIKELRQHLERSGSTPPDETDPVQEEALNVLRNKS